MRGRQVGPLGWSRGAGKGRWSVGTSMLSRRFLDYMEGLAAVSAGPKASTPIANGSFCKVSLKTNQRPLVDASAACQNDGADVVSMVALWHTRIAQSMAPTYLWRLFVWTRTITMQVLVRSTLESHNQIPVGVHTYSGIYLVQAATYGTYGGYSFEREQFGHSSRLFHPLTCDSINTRTQRTSLYEYEVEGYRVI